MSLYYQDDYVTLHHSGSLEVMAGMAEQSVAVVITDPPYTERTHSKARSMSGSEITEGITTFGAITDEGLRHVMTECGRISEGWVIATLDYRHAVEFDVSPPDGLKCQRLGVWVKTNPTPQITGDRPAQGWGVDRLPASRQGPVQVERRWAAWQLRFPHRSSRGSPNSQAVANASGHGAQVHQRWGRGVRSVRGSLLTLRAAVDEGRRAIGVELEERYCEIHRPPPRSGCPRPRGDRMKAQTFRLVIIESPFAGDTEANQRYARAAPLRDCLKLGGEAPLAFPPA